MKTSIRSYQIEDASTIVDILNFNILNSTALYDYHPRTVVQQQAIFEEKLAENYAVPRHMGLL